MLWANYPVEIIQLFGVFREFGRNGLWGLKGAEQRDERGYLADLLTSISRRQNLTEIPPRTDRRLLPTKVRISPFSELVCASNKLRASSTASARTGNPKLGSSCVT